jgi:hypothetical protein
MRAAIIDDKLNIKDLTYVLTGTGNYWDGNIPTVIINGASDKLKTVSQSIQINRAFSLGCESGISL